MCIRDRGCVPARGDANRIAPPSRTIRAFAGSLRTSRSESSPGANAAHACRPTRTSSSGRIRASAT
eukprot:12445105-Alexandrium_andersonii.AAC.1